MDNYEFMPDELFSDYEIESNEIQVDFKDYVIIKFPYNRYEFIDHDTASSYWSIFSFI